MIDSALKERLKTVRQVDFPVAIFKYLFNGKGLDLCRGSKSLNKEDFDPAWFPKDWHSSTINKRGSKRAIVFPVIFRSFFRKTFRKR